MTQPVIMPLCGFMDSQFHFSDDPRIPSIDACQKRQMSFLKRLVHACLFNLIQVPFGNDQERRLYASSAVSVLGIDAARVKWLFSHQKTLEAIASIAAAILRTADAMPSSSSKCDLGVLFKQIVPLLTSYLEAQPTPTVPTTWGYCDWPERKIVIQDRGYLYFFIIENFFSGNEQANSYSLIPKMSPKPVDMAFKLARFSSCSLSYEYNLLRELHRSGPITGIQLPPFYLLYVQKKAQRRAHQGYLGPTYRASGLDVRHETWKAQRNMLAQLVKGVQFLHQRGVVHRDIRPDNVMIHASGRYDLGGFANACYLASLRSWLLQAHQNQEDVEIDFSPLMGLDDKKYTCANELDACQKVVDDFFNHRITIDQALERISLLLKARDIFALGKTLYELLLEDFETFDAEEDLSWTQLSHRLQQTGASSEIVESLLENLLRCMTPLFSLADIYTRLDGLKLLSMLLSS